MRDLRMIGYKMKYVMLPKMSEDKGKELRNCLFLLKSLLKRGSLGTFSFMLMPSNVIILIFAIYSGF